MYANDGLKIRFFKLFSTRHSHNYQKDKMRKLIGLLMVIAIVACTNQQKETLTLSGLNRSNFQAVVDGDSTDLYVLKNANGIEVAITNYGGTIVSVMVPDKNGVMQDVILGFDNIHDYVNIDNNFGSTIGRYGNRLANGRVTIEGVEYTLPQNNGAHTLHGGGGGFNTRVFNVVSADSRSIVMTYLSKDGEEGFPGNLFTTVTMTLTDVNAIDIQYKAETDKPTVVNLTNHAYFNLSGDHNNTILDHRLMINADGFTPVDETLIPIGVIAAVEGTPLDFRTFHTIGDRIDDFDFEQLVFGIGYDHNWVLNTNGDIAQVAATLYSPVTGIQLDVFTVEPGLQVYTGNFLDGTVVGRNGVAYPKRSAICLETQHFPDSPNHPNFPSTLLMPDEIYTSRCIYKFSVR
jgi:aldose 1-epimerase